MRLSQNLLSGKRKYLLGLILFVFISVICVAFSMEYSDDFNISRREVLLRRIGHELLLQSGDSTSRVLPVKKIAKNEYQIGFEHDFTFQPDFLVNTTQRLLAKDPLASDYVVNVLNCANASVAYGYAISKNKKDDIITCRGRRQPIACYMINIKFKPTGITTAKNGYFLGALLLVAFAGFIFLRSVKPQRTLPDSQHTGMITLGSMSFDAETRTLMMNGKTTDLTRTETRVLSIFASSPNEAIERSRLQKEIWEDEGVIVGRSLDMFISKLRKKLEFDPNIKIVVIRGKGYKLEINS
ncbi:Transcriptional regulatory protein, C terminal [Chitinophaga sp. CF118]|uniref:winged helix-turn-helix domain-containing protein n=1 Tax=Chitinophaga sp. CF118 TaxID=1884367 RepID=UPI0008E75E92|nr:winged helix-turn-helix domain-containing protein [Chitinophaga sp. CF118]SFE62919.1 Transcriptional regulatory protein, C terminal [Chitinophaga sp. CF118]